MKIKLSKSQWEKIGSNNDNPIRPSKKMWFLEKDFDIKDYGLFLSKMLESASKHQLSLKILGKVDKYPMFRLTNLHKNNGPNLLICGGFHGEEGAGPWGIIRFLETLSPDTLSKCNLSFLPCVTVTGFIKHKRENFVGDTANGGFVKDPHGDEEDNTPSLEGEILLKHEDSLLNMAKDGFLSLHEDSSEGKFYVYTFERNGISEFSKSIRNTGEKYFEILKHRKMPPPGGGECQDGVVFGNHDGSYEDYIFRKGTPYSACTETPQRADIGKRIFVTAELIKTFVKFFIE